jgi:hypothetical protein
MSAEYMARNDGKGWKFYQGIGNQAKQVHYVEGNSKFNGTEIKTWEDIEAAVAVRELDYALQVGNFGRVWLFNKTAK